MRKGNGTAAIAMLAVALIAAGCGGSADSSEDNGSSSSSDTTAAAATAASGLTKAEFVAQANAVCKQGGEEINREVQRFIKTQGISRNAVRTRPQQEEIVAKFVVPSIQAQAEGLAKLGVPEGDESEVAAIVFDLGKLAKTAGQNPGSILQEGNGNPLEEANKAAKAYGVGECTQP
jgi:hypothetical protein